MSVIQRPDSLSLLGNLKPFIISSTTDVAFSLKKGTDVIISETYHPDSDNRIEIDVKQVISQYLSITIPTSNFFEQANGKAQFIAYLDNVQDSSFTVIRGGVRSLATGADQFLSANWLTWQPQSKQVAWGSPEYLTYYFQAANVIKARFYKTDNITKTITLETGTAGKLMSLNVTLSRIFALADEELTDLQGYVDIWVEAAGGTRLSYIQRLICTDTQGDEHYFMAANSLGGIDTFCFHGAQTSVPEVSHQVAEKAGSKVNITDTAVRKWSQNTGFMGLSYIQWVWELLSSSSQWAIIAGNAESIVLDTSSVSFSDKENLHACTFQFQLGTEGRLLNVTRGVSLSTIEVPSPSGELFFLEARIEDLPDAALGDTILFLVQSSYTNTWSKTSLESIKNWLLNAIYTSSSGLLIHAHSNKAVLDKFTQAISGMPAYDGTELQGKQDALNEFLRKDTEDTAAGKIHLQQGAEFGSSFASGIVGGVGGKIDENGNAELESLVLRKFLQVPELRYNRVDIQIGNHWTAPGGGIIEDVAIDHDALGADLPTGIITLKLEDGEIGTIAVDDICQGIFHDHTTTASNDSTDADDGKGNFHFAGFYSVYFRVTEILDSRKKRFRYQLRAQSATWLQSHHPVQAMHFVSYGNFTNTERQVSRYSTRTYERFLKDVNDWEFTSNMIAAQFGDLSNLSIHGLSMTGYSAYLNNIYMSGTIKQFDEADLRMQIDTDGDSFLAYGETLHISCSVWKGFYDDVTSQVTGWSISRDSGVPLEDAAWLLKPKVKQFDGRIRICFTSAENDLGESSQNSGTIFTITATIEEQSATAYIEI